MSSSTEQQQQETQQSRRNVFRAFTCCALCMMALVVHLPVTTKDAPFTDSLRGKRKNYVKEAIAASNLTGADVIQQLSTPNNNSTRSNTTTTQMDFLVAGFAKCGTTSLLKTFEAHNETAVAPREECSLDMKDNDEEARATILDALRNASSSKDVKKRGIKCPFSFTSDISLKRMEEWFPNTKLIYGLRHPVKAFESSYNYRVQAVHNGKIPGPIPPAETLVSKAWQRVSTETVRFERVLKQLLETNPETGLKFPVFMYTLQQMKDEAENATLRETLGSFLELEYPIEPLAKVNVNLRVGDNGYRETIDVCDDKYKKLRSVLVANAKMTQQWIRDEMLPYATVANRDSFVEHLKQWGLDPCEELEEESHEYKRM